MFAKIAIGDALDISFYESIHCDFIEGDLAETATETVHSITSDVQPDEISNNSYETTSEARNLVNNQLVPFLLRKIDEHDSFLNKAIVKFVGRSTGMGNSKLTSALHTFGSTFFGAKRGKIKVQPAAVARRKSKKGSRQKQDTSGGKSILNNLPLRDLKTKRKHCFSEIAGKNQPSANKAGRSMTSVTKYQFAKVKKSSTSTKKC